MPIRHLGLVTQQFPVLQNIFLRFSNLFLTAARPRFVLLFTAPLAAFFFSGFPPFQSSSFFFLQRFFS